MSSTDLGTFARHNPYFYLKLVVNQDAPRVVRLTHLIDNNGVLTCDAVATYLRNLLQIGSNTEATDEKEQEEVLTISYTDIEGDTIPVAFSQELQDAILISHAQGHSFIKLFVTIHEQQEVIDLTKPPSVAAAAVPGAAVGNMANRLSSWFSRADRSSHTIGRKRPHEEVVVAKEQDDRPWQRPRQLLQDELNQDQETDQFLDLKPPAVERNPVEQNSSTDTAFVSPATSTVENGREADTSVVAVAACSAFAPTNKEADAVGGIRRYGAVATTLAPAMEAENAELPLFAAAGASDATSSFARTTMGDDIGASNNPYGTVATGLFPAVATAGGLVPPVPVNVESSMASMSQVLSSAKPKAAAAKKKKKRPSKAKTKQVGGGSARDRICKAAIELHALGIREPSRVHVALLSGYTNCKSAGFAKALTPLKGEDLIEYPSKKTLKLSEKGLETLKKEYPNVVPPVDNEALHARLCQLISPKAAEIFSKLADGKVHQPQDIAISTGYTNMKSAGFAKSIGTLSSLGILSYPDKTTLQLTDICFPYGRLAVSAVAI